MKYTLLPFYSGYGSASLEGVLAPMAERGPYYGPQVFCNRAVLQKRRQETIKRKIQLR